MSIAPLATTQSTQSTSSPGLPPTGDRLFTRDFLLVCGATIAFFGGFYLQLPILPLWVLAIGGSESDVGLAVGAFSVTALLLRPFVGRESDRLGRKVFVLGGAVIFLLSALLYPLAANVPLLILLRILHGSGIACFTTASSTIVADTVTYRRRGEAMGYFGMSNTVALAVGPAAATALMPFLSLRQLFLASAAVAVTAVLMSAFLSETGRSHWSSVAPKGDLISRPALFPSLVVALLTTTYGAVFVFVPLLAKERGIDPSAVGLFFTVFALLLLAGRAVSGTISDRWGRAAAIVPGMLLAVAAMALLSFSSTLPMLLAAGGAYGLAFAAAHPSLMAFVVDRVPPSGRGSAMGTFSAAFDLGIGLGAMVWGACLTHLGYTGVFASAAVVALMGLLVFLMGSRQPHSSRIDLHPPR